MRLPRGFVALMLVQASAVGSVGGSAAAAVDVVVPDDFPSITLAAQDAVDVDFDGVVHIFVRSGSYRENILVEQRSDLVIEGEDLATTTLFGAGPAPTVELNGCQRVEVRNFTITGDGIGDGVQIELSLNCLLQDNLIQQNADGIFLKSAAGTVIVDNVIRLNGGRGIVASRSDGNDIQFNVIQSNVSSGIEMGNSNANHIESNTIQVNGGFGVRTQVGNLNVIQLNKIFRNVSDGLRVETASKTSIRANEIYRNGGSGLIMRSTQNSKVFVNFITSNVKFGISRQGTSGDDFNAVRSGVQGPPGSNRVVGNRAGNVKNN